MTRRNFLLFLILIHGVFYIMALSFAEVKIPDSYDYLYQAQNLKEQGSLYAWSYQEDLKPDYFTKRTPGYAVFIYVLGSQIGLVLLLQNLLSVLIFLKLYDWLKQSGVSEKLIAMALGIGLLLQTNQLIYANTIISEVLFQYLLFFGIYTLIQEGRDLKWGKAFLAALLFGMALLVKPVLLFFWIPLALFYLVHAIQKKKLLLFIPALILPMLIVIWSFHNKDLTGWFHYTSISTVNLKDYNTRLMLESKFGSEYADSVIAGINEEAASKGTYAERNAYIKDTCSKLIKGNLFAYAKVHAKGMFAMLVDPGRYDYVSFFRVEEGPSGLMYLVARGDFKGMIEVIKGQNPAINFFFFLNLAGSLLLFCFALLGLWRIRNEYYLLIIFLAVIGYFWVLTGPVGTARYKSILLPFMFYLAVQGVGMLQHWRSFKK